MRLWQMNSINLPWNNHSSGLFQNWKERKAFYTALVLGFSYYVAYRLPVEKHIWLWGLIGCCLLFTLLLAFRRESKLVFLLCVFLLGASYFAAVYQQTGYPELHGQKAEVSGVVIDKNVGDTYVTYQVASPVVTANGQETKLQKDIFVTSSKADVAPGDQITFEARLEMPRQAVNDKSFDDWLYCIGKGVIFRSFSDDIVKEGEAFHLTAEIHKLRDWVGERMSTYLDEDTTAIAQSLVIGEKEGLTTEVQEVFSAVGISHLLAISGLHISILIGALTALLSFVNVKVKRILLIAIMLAYIVFTGGAASVIRASLMGILLIGSKMFDREYDTLSSLSAIFILLLLINPTYLFQLGCILSFASVFAIICLAPTFIKLFSKWFPKKMADSIAVTLSATVGTLPLVAYGFGQISLIGIISNLFIIPIFTVCLVLLFAGTVLSVIFVPLSFPFMWVANWILKFIVFLADIFAGLPGGDIPVPTPDDLFLLVCFVVVYLCSRYVSLPAVKKCAAVSGTVSVLLAAFLISYIAAPPMSISFLDVGHGDSILISTKQGNHILVDTGKEGRGTLEYLQSHGLYVDSLIITHNDSDHVGALTELVEDGRVGQILASPQSLADPEKRVQYQALNAQPISMGDAICVGDDITLQVRYPASEATDEDANATSLVMMVKYQGRNICLLTGDATKAAESQLIQQSDLEAPILKAGHHGSDTSSSSSLIRKVNPVYGVFSCDEFSYGLPDENVVELFEKYGAQILATDEMGQITFEIYDDHIAVRTKQTPLWPYESLSPI